jgi:hypothetical protein
MFKRRGNEEMEEDIGSGRRQLSGPRHFEEHLQSRGVVPSLDRLAVAGATMPERERFPADQQRRITMHRTRLARKKALARNGWQIVADSRTEENYRLVLRKAGREEVTVEAASRPRAYAEAERQLKD